MAISKTVFSSMAEFVAWAEANLIPAYFGAVDLDSSTNTFTGYQDAEKTKPVFQFIGGNSCSLKAYKDASTAVTVSGKSQASPTYPKNAYVCSNGVMINDLPRSMSAILTKTNRGIVAVAIVGTNGTWTSAVMTETTCYCCAYGDDTTITTATVFKPIDANQTAFVPFCTYAPYNTVSYTPKAFYLTQGQYYTAGDGKFTAGGKSYITNGYFALLDD